MNFNRIYWGNVETLMNTWEYPITDLLSGRVCHINSFKIVIIDYY
jgi:hypothetical protein